MDTHLEVLLSYFALSRPKNPNLGSNHKANPLSPRTARQLLTLERVITSIPRSCNELVSTITIVG